MKTRQDTTGTWTFKIKHHVFREPNDTHKAQRARTVWPAAASFITCLSSVADISAVSSLPGFDFARVRLQQKRQRRVTERRGGGRHDRKSCFLSRQWCDVLMWNMTPGASLPLCTPPIISHRVQSCPAMASISCFLYVRLAGTWFPTVTQQESGGRRRALVAGSIVEKKAHVLL